MTKNKENEAISPKKIPLTGQLIINAIENLAERKGSSFQQIIKYIAALYPDIDLKPNFYKRFLKNGLETGVIVNKTSRGLSGRFKVIDKKLKELYGAGITIDIKNKCSLKKDIDTKKLIPRLRPIPV